MSLFTVCSRALIGVTAPLVSIETHISNGLPALSIVGLPEAAVRESKDRVRSAIINSGFDFPARRITINMAPADLPKGGGRFDLAIAVSILAASGQLGSRAKQLLAGVEMYGELSLSGEIRPVAGLLPAALAGHDAGHAILTAASRIDLLASLEGSPSFGFRTLRGLASYLESPESEEAVLPQAMPACPSHTVEKTGDLGEVCGQHQARRGLEIAAAGHHHLLMSGPPGSGKTMLATRMQSLLPDLSQAQAFATASIYSVVQGEANGSQRTGDMLMSERVLVTRRAPFRAPHHSASPSAIVGGGRRPQPGEISLAHNGTLFLDELPEFSSRALEALRQPLESHVISVSRAQQQIEYPACFLLIAAMNPCPCGHDGQATAACTCSALQVKRYRDRISGPIIDRFDLQLSLAAVRHGELGHGPRENSAAVAARVLKARERQLARQATLNGLMDAATAQRVLKLEPGEQALMERVAARLNLSARGWFKVLKVARTIADLAAAETMAPAHLLEAVAFSGRESGI